MIQSKNRTDFIKMVLLVAVILIIAAVIIFVGVYLASVRSVKTR